MGCMIAWVSNIHISNNVSEAEKHVTWTLMVTSDYINDIESVSTGHKHNLLTTYLLNINPSKLYRLKP